MSNRKGEKRMNDAAKIRKMSEEFRKAADALEETAIALDNEDEEKAEAEMGRFIIKMMNIQEFANTL